MKRLVALCLTLAFAAAGARAQSLDDVLARHYEAMGGLDRTRAVQAVKMTGTAEMPMQGITLEMTFYQQRPNHVRVEQTFDGQKLVQAFDGQTAWMINPFMGAPEPTEVPGPNAAQLAEMGDFDGPLYDYAVKGHTVELLGQEDVDGTPAYKIRVRPRNSDEQLIYLDAETYLTLRKVMRGTQQGQEIEAVQDFSDYRSVGGIMVPHVMEMSLNGQSISKITYTSVDLNPTFEEGFFSMPRK